MQDNIQQQSSDKIKRIMEKSVEDDGISPMSPPDYFQPPSKIEEVPYDKLPSPIRKLVEEHKQAIQHLEKFQNALVQFKESGFKYTPELSATFKEFFNFFDNQLIPHHQKEDKFLFPLLEKYLLKSGEHSKYMNNHQYETSIDVMEDDHLKMLQVGSLIFNLLGIYVRIPDNVSRNLIADIVFNKGMEFIDLLRVHIYQEENILFPQSVKFLTKEEFASVAKHIK